jgi:cyanophycin synthetase
MNVFDEHPFKVILDYGHNPSAVELMCGLARRLEVTGRRLVVLAAPGDRRDADVRAIARAAAGHFDRYVLRRDDSLRGRAPDEIPALLRAELLAAGVPADAVDVIPDEREATDHALRLAEPGDLLLVFGDALTRTWKQIISFRADLPATAGTTERRASAEPPSRQAAAPPGRRAAEPAASAASAEPAAWAARRAEADVEEQLVVDERGVRLQREHDD